VNDDASQDAKLLFDRPVPPDVLAEWTAQAARPKDEPGGLRIPALLVRAGNEWVALPSEVVDQALPVGPIHAVPYLSNAVFLGLANVDGELLPCVSLAELLGAEPSLLSARPRLVVVRLEEGRFALLVEETPGMRGYEPAALVPPPDTLARAPHPVVTGMAAFGERLAGVADAVLLGRALARSLAP